MEKLKSEPEKCTKEELSCLANEVASLRTYGAEEAKSIEKPIDILIQFVGDKGKIIDNLGGILAAGFASDKKKAEAIKTHLKNSNGMAIKINKKIAEVFENVEKGAQVSPEFREKMRELAVKVQGEREKAEKNFAEHLEEGDRKELNVFLGSIDEAVKRMKQLGGESIT